MPALPLTALARLTPPAIISPAPAVPADKPRMRFVQPGDVPGLFQRFGTNVKLLAIPESGELEDVYLSAPAIARLLGLPVMRTRRRLERWRRENRDQVCIMEDGNRKERGPGVYYCLHEVLPVIRDLANDSNDNAIHSEEIEKN